MSGHWHTFASQTNLSIPVDILQFAVFSQLDLALACLKYHLIVRRLASVIGLCMPLPRSQIMFMLLKFPRVERKFNLTVYGAVLSI